MFGRILKYSLLTILVSLIAVVTAVNYWVDHSTRGQLYSDIAAIPKNKVGLLLGTAKYNDKGKRIINTFYQNRIDATVALYMAGKIDYIIVSGDKSSVNYDEPAIMRDDLVSRGVPSKKIYLDNAGFRTLDSILRCRDIFGQDHVTVISQEFHNQRALFIANHKKVRAIAFNAKEGDSFMDTYIRERLARVKMGIDLLMNTQAKYYGDRVEIN